MGVALAMTPSWAEALSLWSLPLMLWVPPSSLPGSLCTGAGG